MIKNGGIPIILTCACLSIASGAAAAASNGTQTIRIVTYNIEDDIDGATTPLPGLIVPSSGGTALQGGVLEGIGEEILGNDPAQPLDILALEETTGNSVTVTPIVAGLNSFYSAPGMYAMSAYQATESGGVVDDGNGPNALVYNTTTLQLIASAPVDPPGGTGQLGSTSGEYREAMRYEFAPGGVMPAPTNEFYVYVSHYKSGTTSADLTDRNGEAQIIRNDGCHQSACLEKPLLLSDRRRPDLHAASQHELIWRSMDSTHRPADNDQWKSNDNHRYECRLSAAVLPHRYFVAVIHIVRRLVAGNRA